jgi:hypothetical protein
MGLGTENRRGSLPGGPEPVQRARFGAFFPQVFAFAHSLTGDEVVAREVVVEAFSRVFEYTPDPDDDEFVILLFEWTREICRAVSLGPARDGGLSGRERELLALLFDARLDHDVVRRLMHASEASLSQSLLSALRKLRSSIASAPNPYLHPAS